MPREHGAFPKVAGGRSLPTRFMSGHYAAMFVRVLAQQACSVIQLSQIGTPHTGQRTECAWHPAVPPHSALARAMAPHFNRVLAGWVHFRHNGEIASEFFGWHGGNYTPLVAARVQTSQPISGTPAAWYLRSNSSSRPIRQAREGRSCRRALMREGQRCGSSPWR